MAPEMENKRPDWQPKIGVLSLITAALAVAIFLTTGEWPNDAGVWGAVMFVVLGIVVIWDARRTPTD